MDSRQQLPTPPFDEAVPSDATAPTLPGLRNPWSLRFTFGFVVGVPVLLLFGILIFHDYYVNRREAAASLHLQMISEAKTRAKTLNYHLSLMSRGPDQVARAITIRTPRTVDEMLSFQYAMLADTSIIYGNAVAWEPYTFDPQEKYCSPYTWRDLKQGGAVANMMFTPENGYDYLVGWEWYDAPKKKYGGTGETSHRLNFTDNQTEQPKLPRIEPGLWCAPYFDEGGGNVLMCTYSAPFFKNNRFAGVVTCDVTTDWIGEFLSQKSFEGGFFVLVGRNGSLISHPRSELIMKSIDTFVDSARDPSWKEMIAEMHRIGQSYENQPFNDPLSSNEGIYLPTLSRVLPDLSNSEPIWIESVQLPATGWILLCVVPQKTAYRTTDAQFQSNLLFFFFGLLALCCYVFWHVSHRIIRPLQQMVLATQAIAEGDFDHQITMKASAGKELTALSHHFNTMAGALRQSIADAVKNASAKEMAEAANRAKSEFLMLVSHELRTPLSGVIGTTDLLMQTELNAKQQEYTELLKESGVALLLLINNILDYSKADLGDIAIRKQEFHLRTLLESVFLLLRFQAKSRNLALRYELDENISEQVYGDEGRIRQVLSNLLANAIKFSHDGEVTLRVTLDQESTPERQVIRFEVTDQGVGITEEQQQNIFSRLWQSNMSSKRDFDGMGLGLAISRHIVDSLQGSIGVRSVVGKGSTFWMTVLLPAVLADNGPVDISVTPAPVAIDEEKPEDDSRKIRILIAEDNRINQIVIKEMLVKAGYDCTIVDNGRKAVDAWQAEAFDLILMDCQMPEMDGYEATRLIREMENKAATPKTIPIIALTANTAPGDKEYCLQVGMSSYCNKPVNAQELFEVIASWIDETPSMPE